MQEIGNGRLVSALLSKEVNERLEQAGAVLRPRRRRAISCLDAAKEAILRAVRVNSDAIARIVGVYDHAYDGLVERSQPQTFRQFLLGAPSLFLELGDKIGAMSHVSSFWSYRFPPGMPRVADAEELTLILHDFVQSLVVSWTQGGDEWPTALEGQGRSGEIAARPGNPV